LNKKSWPDIENNFENEVYESVGYIFQFNCKTGFGDEMT
jgi:hypothetical protein